MSVSRPSGFLGELTWRGLLYQRTAEEALESHLAVPGRVAYCGFDPTVDSLTIGNLFPVRLLRLWQRAGHKPIVLVGGGTALIGDPSGKDTERPLLTRETVRANAAGQRRILERLLDFEAGEARSAVLVDNASWLGELRYLDVLRDVGKHFSVNAMIQREAVRERLHQRHQGISYTEFSYCVLQAYDFLHLHRTLNCTVQLAGSDQFGNIVSGIDLVHRTLGQGADAFGITCPLLTHSDGRKIGKSEGAPVWLSADRTSPYAFYQYWINVPDADVGSFLRWFTDLGEEELAASMDRHVVRPEERNAQRALAEHMTDAVHGVDERRLVAVASEVVFGRGDPRAIDARTLEQVVAELPRSRHARDSLSAEGVALVDLLPITGLASSRREAREFLDRGAVWVNGERAALGRSLGPSDLLHCRTILLRRGKKHWHAAEWE